MTDKDFVVVVDTTTDVNEAIVRWPYGGASFAGSRHGREHYAQQFAIWVTMDRRRQRFYALVEEVASWHLNDSDDNGEIARELNAMLQDKDNRGHLDP